MKISEIMEGENSSLKKTFDKAIQDEAVYQILISEVVKDLSCSGGAYLSKSQIRGILNTLVEQVRKMQKKEILMLITEEIVENQKTGVATSNLTRLWNKISNLK